MVKSQNTAWDWAFQENAQGNLDVNIFSGNENSSFGFPLEKIMSIGEKYFKEIIDNINLFDKFTLIESYTSEVKCAISDAFECNSAEDKEKGNKNFIEEFIEDCAHEGTGSFAMGHQLKIFETIDDERIPLDAKHTIANESFKEVVEHINETCKRYQYFIDNKFYRKTATKGAIEIFKEVIGAFVRQIEEKNIRLIVKGGKVLQEHCMSTYSDYKNYIIMSNLLGNAIKYSPSNSIIEIAFNVKENDKHLYFCIKDMGIGIPKEDQKSVLKQSRASNVDKIPGTGYGLYRTTEFVKSIGGDVKIVSPLYEDEPKYKGTMIECPLISNTNKSLFQKIRNQLANSTDT